MSTDIFPALALDTAQVIHLRLSANIGFDIYTGFIRPQQPLYFQWGCVPELKVEPADKIQRLSEIFFVRPNLSKTP